MEKFTFIVPIKGVVEMDVMAESLEEAREKIIKGQEYHEGFPEIDTWYTSKAFLKEEE